MTVLFRFFSLWPLWALHAAGTALGWLVFLLSVRYRRQLRNNASLAGLSAAQCRQAVAHAGRMIAELPRLWAGAPVRVQWDGEALVDAARVRGRGVLFLTPHLGCFEITARAYAERYGATQGPSMTVLFREPRLKGLVDTVWAARQRPGLKAVPTTLAGVKQLMRALSRSEAVGLLPDQVPPQGQGVWAPFFNRPAYTMTLAARLMRCGEPTVLVAWGERLSWGRGYVVHLSAFDVPVGADAETVCTAVNRAMESVIRRCPEQYLWAYNRYKPPLNGDAA